MQKIQTALLDYVRHNKYLSPFLKFSSVLAVIYPIYLLVSRISILDPVWNYVSSIDSILLIAYYIGTILCFASNKLIPLDIAYCCRAINYIFSLQHGITLNVIVYLAFYSLISGICIVATKNNSQWARLKETTFNKAAQYAEAAGDAISGKSEEEYFCPNCGKKCNKKMKFCNNCGTKIN